MMLSRWLWLSPLKPFKGDAPKYFWNEACLRAPKPYKEYGFYAYDPRRRVRPGLLPAPKGFRVPEPEKLNELLLASMKSLFNSSKAIDKLLDGAM